MKKWKHPVKIKGQLYEVRELTDAEATRALRKGYKYAAPISMGYVSLYQDGELKRNCGVHYAKRNSADPVTRLQFELEDAGISMRAQAGRVAEEQLRMAVAVETYQRIEKKLDRARKAAKV